MSYQKTLLDQGLVLLTMPMPNVRSVCVTVFISVGARCEGEAEAGVSHFIEHMLFKGSNSFPSARLISEAIEGIGGYINAGTSRETTMYWVKVAQPHVRMAIRVLADMLIRPTLEPLEIEKERQVVIEEINMLCDSPESLVQMFANELVWAGHGLGRDISGTKETVSAITRDSLIEFMAHHYGPTRAVISIAGAIRPKEIQQIVQEEFGHWKPASEGILDRYCDDHTNLRSKVYFKETEQAHICIALPSIERSHPDRFPLSLANTVLGDGMSSRLFQEIRERQALAYSVDSFVTFMQDTGMLGVYAGVDPRRSQRAMTALMAELGRMREELVSSEELVRAIEFNKGRLLLQMENTTAVATWYGRQEVLPGDVYSVDEVVHELERTTREDIQRVMAALVVPEKLNLAVVGPFSDPEPLTKLCSLNPSF